MIAMNYKILLSKLQKKNRFNIDEKIIDGEIDVDYSETWFPGGSNFDEFDVEEIIDSTAQIIVDENNEKEVNLNAHKIDCSKGVISNNFRP